MPEAKYFPTHREPVKTLTASFFPIHRVMYIVPSAVRFPPDFLPLIFHVQRQRSCSQNFFCTPAPEEWSAFSLKTALQMAFFFDTFSDTLLVIAVLSAAAQKQLDRYPRGLSIRSIPLHLPLPQNIQSAHLVFAADSHLSFSSMVYCHFPFS